MTREDINRINSQYLNDCENTGEMEEIFALAIQALEQEPTTKNDLGVDCIDRQATLDAIIKRLGIKNESYLLSAERTIYQQIKDMPSVTPQEPKTGHWIDDEFGSKCSCCDIHTHLDKFDRPMKFKYCSVCGAKMVEPQESVYT